MEVRQWMTAPAITVGPQASVWEAMQLMVSGNFRRLPVVEGETLIGLITQGDIQNRIFLSMMPTSQDIPPALKSTVESIMARSVVTVEPETEITEAALKMVSNGIGGLPVLERNHVVGMITVRDMFNALMELEKQTRQQAARLELEVRARTRHLEILNAAIQAATRSLETEDVFRDISGVIRELFAFDRSSILLLNDTEDAFIRFELYSEKPVDVHTGVEVPREESLSGWVVDHNLPVHVNDLAADTARPKYGSLKGMGSAIVLPLSAHGKVFGTLTFTSVQKDAFTPRDFTLAQQVSRQVAQALHNMRQYQRVQHLVAQLQEADRVRNEFMGIVSHDLRSPLASIYGYVQLFRDQKLGPLPEKYQPFTHDICRIVEYMQGLVEDLLAVGQLGARGMKLHPEALDVAAFVSDLIGSLEAQAGDKQVRLRREVDHGLHVLADRVRLRQLLTNLIVNGIKFNRPDGEVALLVTREADQVRFEVRDTGIGIAEKDLGRLFDLFTRVHQDRRTDGTGLGLFIARQIALLHGGDLQVTSQENVGTSFILTLPLAVPASSPAV
ncbi:MAG: ATP-binding protein [Candidatus Xenobia bacterium]